MDLESRNKTLQTEMDNLTPSALSQRSKDPSSWLPRHPPRHVMESHRNVINCVAFHPVFSSVATGSDDYTIKIWDWEEGEIERTIKGHTRAVLDVDFGGPRGGILLASCSSDLKIKLWDPSDDYKNIRTLPGHDHSVSAVRFIPSSGNLLVSASRDKTIKIWDITTGYCVRTLEGHSAWVRDISPSFDGKYLFSTGDDQTGRLWDISTQTAETKMTMIGHEHFNEYQHLAPLAGLKKPPPITSSAEFMATGSRDKTIKLWDARGQCIKTLVGHDNWVRGLVFHPGGKYLISVSDDKSLRAWDLSQEGKCVKVLSDSHEHFISCVRWAPSKAVTEPNGETNGSPSKNAPAPEGQIRCVLATVGVDWKLRIFAN
jgi:platelet-activating factor acetylhydrolase IB subunit alpha